MTPSRVTAILGPTNTGKTHAAIERMLAHRTGVIGLPLRLLAREVYDRIVRLRGPSVVALVTGEERIVPDRAQYWVCTVEAMPDGMGADFLAVDEIQLCADPERGHVFTDRLLHARGLHETLFLGSDTMRGAIAALVPGVTFQHKERFSTLSYVGPKKITRMPERSAIVGFSVDNVYAIAEFIRRTRGGAAVVMGALSPRTRNAQVELYQNGDVDFLVATDAIGMGLNLDIGHVAFSSVAKFDGHRMRHLAADELAQIAGRAGRHMAPGTFGVTGEAPPLDEDVVEAIEAHRFAPVRRLQWRNARLQFGSVKRLIQTLEERTDDPWLARVRESDDLAALKALAGDAEVAARATDGPSVKLLWDVCRIPDFRGISRGEHATMLSVIFNYLHQRGQVPSVFMAEQVGRISRTDGDIDTLSKRLAFIRTWTYVAQRKGWVGDETHWRTETRAVEDRLSDALHAALSERFVDRRTSVLARRLRQREALVAEVDDKGEVTVEGHAVGRLEGFRFRAGRASNPEEARTLQRAAVLALAPQFSLRADRFYNAPDTELDFTEQGGLMWGEHAVGRLSAGPDPLRPEVVAFVDEDAGPEVVQKVQRRLQHFIDRKVAAAMDPLLALERDEAMPQAARGFAYRLRERFGIILRADVADEVRALDQEARASLRKHGVRFGQFTVFLPALLKPAPTRLRLLLWGLSKGLAEFPSAPPPGVVTVPTAGGSAEAYAMSGYRAAGERAIRIDMLERLADLLRDKDSRAGFEAGQDMLSITGLGMDAFAALMEGLGYRAEKGERPKVRAKAAKPGPLPDETPREAPVEAPSQTPPAVPGGLPDETPQEPPVEEPPSPEEVPPAPIEDPAPLPEAPPDEVPEPGVPAPEIPVEEPAEEPAAPPLELPSSQPDEAPGYTPVEMPDYTPAEMPMDQPMEMPGAPMMEGAAPAVPEGLAEAQGPAEAQGTAEATAAGGADGAPVETEAFYTFTWGRRPARDAREGPREARPRRENDRARGPRRDGAPAPAAAPAGDGAQPVAAGAPPDAAREARGPRPDRPRGPRPDAARPDRPRADRPNDDRAARPRPDRGPDRGDRGPDRGPRPAAARAQTFEAAPPRASGRVDPDNPFAAALAGFKAK